MTGLFSEAVQAELTLRDRGLARRTIIAGEAPKVTPRDLTVHLPDGIEYGLAYGTPEEFIAYLRRVHSIPGEAEQTIETNQGITTEYRVTWRWWEVSAPVSEDLS